MLQGRRVVVVGAGLAGLAAAHELAGSGAQVTIVDARERAGGRVWTVRQGFAAEQYGELGGELIDEDHTEMRRLAGKFGLPLVQVLHGGFTQRFRSGGSYRVERDHAWHALEAVFAPLAERYRAAAGDPGAAAVREIARYSVRGWLRHQGADAELHAIADALRGFFLADAEELSALPLVEQMVHGSPGEKNVFRIAGGMSTLVDALAAAAGARLLLRHHVRAIAEGAAGVTVHTASAAGPVQIDADLAVLALPASTLRDIEIRPALADAQWRAVGAVQYGRATKIVLQCEGRGLGRRRARAFATDTHLGAFWDATEGQPASSHAIVNFLAGGSASAWIREHAGHDPADLLDDLCWLRLDGTAVTTSHVATWEDDPLARGGYAFWDPAFDPAWRPLLSRRTNRLVFAGEHTSAKWQGYMEGAVESGLRAARELIQAP